MSENGSISESRCSEWLAVALLDIPVYKSRVQSLHVLFSLYAAFKNSQVYATCLAII